MGVGLLDCHHHFILLYNKRYIVCTRPSQLKKRGETNRLTCVRVWASSSILLISLTDKREAKSRVCCVARQKTNQIPLPVPVRQYFTQKLDIPHPHSAAVKVLLQLFSALALFLLPQQISPSDPATANRLSVRSLKCATRQVFCFMVVFNLATPYPLCLSFPVSCFFCIRLIFPTIKEQDRLFELNK